MMHKPTCIEDFVSGKEVANHGKAVIGDDSIPIDIRRVNKWNIVRQSLKRTVKAECPPYPLSGLWCLAGCC